MLGSKPLHFSSGCKFIIMVLLDDEALLWFKVSLFNFIHFHNQIWPAFPQHDSATLKYYCGGSVFALSFPTQLAVGMVARNFSFGIISPEHLVTNVKHLSERNLVLLDFYLWVSEIMRLNIQSVCRFHQLRLLKTSRPL